MILADVTIATTPLVIWLAVMTPIVIWVAVAAMQACRDRFGDYPRGTRWLIRAGKRPASAIRRGAVRVFYGKQQQKEEQA